MLYSVANVIWKYAKWVWLTVIVVIAGTVISNLLLVHTTDMADTVLASVIRCKS